MYLLPRRGVVPDAKMVAQPTRESAVPERSYVVGLILRTWTYYPTLLSPRPTTGGYWSIATRCYGLWRRLSTTLVTYRPRHATPRHTTPGQVREVRSGTAIVTCGPALVLLLPYLVLSVPSTV